MMGCAAGYAITANTILSAEIAITTDTAPLDLSAQQIVDCTDYYENDGAYLNFQCEGGRVLDSWMYGHSWGMFTEDKYKYEGIGRSCKHEEKGEPQVIYNFEQHENIAGVDYAATVEDIATKMQEGPLSAIIEADCDKLWFYKSGVLRASDCEYSGTRD